MGGVRRGAPQDLPVLHAQHGERGRMSQTREEVLNYVLQTVQNLCQDWDYADPVGPESLLFTGLGLESLDAVVLCTAIQEHYRITMPFAELLADIGEKRRDLSIAELADFVDQHINAAAGQESKTNRQEVEVGSPRRSGI